MKFILEISLACVISLLCIQQIFCALAYSAADEISDTSGANKWTCSCSSAYPRNQSFAILVNCSKSCDCNPDVAAEGSTENRWICICGADKFPEVASNDRNSSCFTSCNCNSGVLSNGQSSEKGIWSKVVVIIFLLCILMAIFVFTACALCCIYRREKPPRQSPIFSSSNESNFGSGGAMTNFTNRRTTNSAPEFKVYVGSPARHVTLKLGCFSKALFLFKGKAEAIQGTIIQFSYMELENSTNHFSESNLIGIGGSSRVYRGLLTDGTVVAIKRMKTPGGTHAESALLKEIELISRLHHCHVVNLIGYCSEYHRKHAERLLVFEYMPNGNLRECLDTGSGKFLDWNTRIMIALGAARGLEYLHEAAAPRILHRDVKSTNILLDANWIAKITDLGMAQHLTSDGVPSCSNYPDQMQGTFGYFAPEYAIIGTASPKSDVFSFGVVLLELITGRQPIHKSSEKGEQSLVIWCMPRLQDSKRVIQELPDPILKGDFNEEEMQIMAYLAKECLLLEPDSRPTMTEVVQTLSTISSEKSRSRNFSTSFFRSLSNRPSKIEQATGAPDRKVEGRSISDELRRTLSNQWLPRTSLPINLDRALCSENSEKEHIEGLILLTSYSKNYGSQDGEAVDLTEPRFESFQMNDIAVTPSS